MKIKKIHVYLTVVLLTFGFMISYSIQFTKTTTTSLSPITDSQWEKRQQLQERIISEQMEVQKLEEQLQDIKQKVSAIESKVGASEEQAQGILRELEQARMWAGLIPVKGSGIIFTLKDSSNVPESANVNDFIVHEENIRQVVNELFAAGAEAISINGQRLTANSAIRCVGPTVLVNEVKMVPPFEISAIGEPETLGAALNMPGGAVEMLKNWTNIDFNLEKKEYIEIPAFAGNTDQFKAEAEREGADL